MLKNPNSSSSNEGSFLSDQVTKPGKADDFDESGIQGDELTMDNEIGPIRESFCQMQAKTNFNNKAFCDYIDPVKMKQYEEEFEKNLELCEEKMKKFVVPARTDLVAGPQRFDRHNNPIVPRFLNKKADKKSSH